MLNDEIETLTWRIKYLKNFVDFFVIAESNLTFSGHSKPYHSESLRDFIDLEPSRIIQIKYEFPDELLRIRNTTGNNWPLENFGRNALLKVIDKLGDTDLVILSDVDEIPALEQLTFSMHSENLVSLVTPLYYGRLNWISPDGSNWNTVKFGKAVHFKNNDLNLLKHYKCPTVSNSLGGHYSDQFDNFSQVSKKMMNSAHSEYQEMGSLHQEIFDYSSNYRVNHFGRFYRKGMGIIRAQEKSELNEFQSLVQSSNPEKFDFSKPKAPFVLRFVASHTVTKAWKVGELQIESEVKMRGKFPFLLMLYCWKRFQENWIRIIRKIKKSLLRLRNANNV